jgi:hypothetical protein
LKESLGERLPLAHHLPLHQVGVEVAVIVVVDQPDARRNHFGEIELARHAVEVRELQAGVVGPIGEPLAVAWFRIGGTARRARLATGFQPIRTRVRAIGTAAREHDGSEKCRSRLDGHSLSTLTLALSLKGRGEKTCFNCHDVALGRCFAALTIR